MIRFGGVFFILALAVSLLLMPAAVFAATPYDGLSKCQWDPVKWETAPIPWNLYIKHWGRTPMDAMSSLAGLCGPDAICSSKWGLSCKPGRDSCWKAGCSSCNDEAGALAACDDPVACNPSECAPACNVLGVGDSSKCPTCNPKAMYGKAHCASCWGVSLSFANKSWAGCDIDKIPRLNNDQPNHFGNSIGGAKSRGGDWGITGSSHTECISGCWALQSNMCTAKGTGCVAAK